MAALSVAGWLVEPIMEKIINACFDYLGKQTGMEEMLERLQYNRPKIQAVVFAANQAQITSDPNSGLNTWIWQLRNALDEVNDVLDELEYINHEEQLPKNMEETMLESVLKTLDKIGERAFKRDPTLKRLEEAVKKLDKVSADVTPFFLLLDRAEQQQKKQEDAFLKTRITGPLPKNDLIGRGMDKESVVQWLRKPSNEHQGTVLHRNISLLSIVGHGGMGKTTLLQHVYKDEEITKEFDLKMWVCVSNNFDVNKVIADMLECLENERPRLETLGELQRRVQMKVMSKKFLLVLDDIWEEDENGDISKWEDKWGNVLASLADGGFGSKIMVTTRTDSVTRMFENVIKKKMEHLRIDGLEEKECLELLNTHAFGVDNLDGRIKLKLELITAEIVKKLSGSPLAAKVIGGTLNRRLDEDRWRSVLDSVTEIIKSDQKGIMHILGLSYIHLPQHLKSCFTFCSIFPQDYEFDKDDLVRMWNALGFIQLSDIQGETMEDIGGMYFDDLVKKSFFDKFENKYSGRYYKMHDLIHQLAQSLSKEECLRVEDSTKLPSRIPKTLRHLSVKFINLDIIKKIGLGQFKYLHSLFLFYKGYNEQDLCNALLEIFKASRSLRLLYIWAPTSLKIIPEEIGNLIHLRYLNIEVHNLVMLPISLSNLYHLKYLLHYQYIKDVANFLPSGFNNLSNLCYMKLPKFFTSSICGVGKLKFLQELHKFKHRDENGYRIGELENMNDLCKLEINCLENVKDSEEACSAKLYAKKRLTDLTLCWSNIGSRNIDLDVSVLDNLQPPNCLRNLRIEGYMGASWSSIWMNNVDQIFNLEKIELSGCLECETLPPFGQLRFLKSLKLKDMPKVKWLESKFNGKAFPSLEELWIEELRALEDWFEAGVAAEDDGCLFPSLIQLVLVKCPMLKELPSLPSKINKLVINNIGWTTLNFCSNSNPIPLESLEVFDCPNITSLPLADEIARLAALRYLEIIKCPNLRSLGNYPEVGTSNNYHLMLNYLCVSDPSVLLMEPLSSIASLKKLSITFNDEVVSFPNEAEQWFLNIRSSLSELQFKWLKSLESLPSSMESLSSLQELCIINCPNLISLGRYGEVETTNTCHPMLSTLRISDPSVLLMEPLRSIASLKVLFIEQNDEVVSFSNEAEQWLLNVRSSLSYLYFWQLKSLESLPSSLESLSSLEFLDIWDVPMLRELPNLPLSLKRLYIWGSCHPELKERYGEDGGSHRHKIAHIPRISIIDR